MRLSYMQFYFSVPTFKPTLPTPQQHSVVMQAIYMEFTFPGFSEPKLEKTDVKLKLILCHSGTLLRLISILS